jgi:uncharacterized metal-binding protein YceD (DUF177 family)
MFMSEATDFMEFSRPVEAASIGPRGTGREVRTTPAERAAIAAALDLLALDLFAAEVSLRRLASGLIEVSGTLTASVVQACVVTLEPVAAEVSDTFQVTFGAEDTPPELSEIEIDYEALDPPEPIVDGIIDLGRLVVEHLSLALDPYPRKPDAAIPQEYEPKPEEIAEKIELKTHKPFAGLDKLIK